MSRLKTHIQSLVTEKIPDAFTLRKAELPRKIPTGIQPLDLLIQGFQRGDLTEIYGQGSSGRTTLAISFMAEVTRRAEACALVDVSDSLDPESLSAAGVDLDQLLWIRCGKAGETLRDSSLIDQVNPYFTPDRPIPSSSAVPESNLSSGRHPRHEVQGLSNAIATLMRSRPDSSLAPDLSPRWGEGNPPVVPPCTRGGWRGVFNSPIRGEGARRAGERICATVDNLGEKSPQGWVRGAPSSKTIWKRLGQALRVTDLLLNNGGFAAVVVDLGDMPTENARRIPLTSWFRFRRSVENTPTALVLLSKEPCCGTCASLVLHCQCRQVRWLSVSNSAVNSYMLTLKGLDLAVGKTRCRGQSQVEVMSGRYSSLAGPVHWQTHMSWAR